MATGEVFRYLSDDDVPVAGAFHTAVRYLESHPDVDVLFGQGNVYYNRFGLGPILFYQGACGAASISVRNLIRETGPVPPSEAAFFRRRVVDRMGVFNLQYPGADREFWIRLAKAGLRMEVIPERFVDYYLSDISGLVRKRRAIILQKVSIALRYGKLSDIVYVGCVLTPYDLLREFLGLLGIYPVKIRLKRLLRGEKRRLQSAAQ
jgi:hypothetical protein